MKHSAIIDLLKNGVHPLITFNKGAEDLECYPEANMRARIIGAVVEHDDVMKLTVSYAEFDEFNKSFESSNYYNKNGNAVWTAREADLYTITEVLYVMADADVGTAFTINDGNIDGLYNEYKETGSTDDYVTWLENQVKNARAKTK
jgi:hypothetical protein